MSDIPVPQPTPYDILPLPYFAWSPDSLTWICALAGAAIAVSVAWYLSHSPRKQISSGLWDAASLLDQRLQQLGVVSNLTREQVSEASLLIRRFISIHEHTDISPLSSAELLKQTADAPPALKRLVSGLAALEQSSYAPRPVLQASQITELRKAISEYMLSDEGDR